MLFFTLEDTPLFSGSREQHKMDKPADQARFQKAPDRCNCVHACISFLTALHIILWVSLHEKLWLCVMKTLSVWPNTWSLGCRVKRERMRIWTKISSSMFISSRCWDSYVLTSWCICDYVCHRSDGRLHQTLNTQNSGGWFKDGCFSYLFSFSAGIIFAP